jgi:peptidoglycan hydrolase-like protein with peptidoglycan-binding domain
MGYYEGPITATVGPKTKAAISEFERAFSLPVTGRITPGLLGRLGISWP